MNRLQKEIHQRQLAQPQVIDRKRTAKTSARDIIQYGSAASNSFSHFLTAEKTKDIKFRATSIDIMVNSLAGAKLEIKRLNSLRNKDIRRPVAAIYMARARRMNDGVAPKNIGEAIDTLIREQVSYCKGLVLSARQIRTAVALSM